MQSVLICVTPNRLSLRQEILTYAFTLIVRDCWAVFKAAERISVTKITEKGQRNAEISRELVTANYKSSPSWNSLLIEYYPEEF